MAVAKKGRRKFVFNERLFVWYVEEDDDNFPTTVEYTDRRALNIVSEDKKFIVRYHICQTNLSAESVRHITVLGKEFAGTECNGTWRRFECPKWCERGSVQPSDVREIIEWCLAPDKSIVEVNYRGTPLVKTSKED